MHLRASGYFHPREARRAHSEHWDVRRDSSCVMSYRHPLSRLSKSQVTAANRLDSVRSSAVAEYPLTLLAYPLLYGYKEQAAPLELLNPR